MKPQSNRPKRSLTHSYINKIQLFSASILILVLFLFYGNASGEKVKVAILPFENMSGEFCNIENLMDRVYQRVKDSVEVPSREETDNVLIDLRLRHTGFLTTKDALEIEERLHVQGIMTGIITHYKESPEPQIGLIMKLIGGDEDASIVWMKADSATGSDKETWFGLRKVTDKVYFYEHFIRQFTDAIPFDRITNNGNKSNHNNHGNYNNHGNNSMY